MTQNLFDGHLYSYKIVLNFFQNHSFRNFSEFINIKLNFDWHNFETSLDTSNIALIGLMLIK